MPKDDFTHLLQAIKGRKPLFAATLEKAKSIMEILFQHTALPTETSQVAPQLITPTPLGVGCGMPIATDPGEATLGPPSIPDTIDPRMIMSR